MNACEHEHSTMAVMNPAETLTVIVHYCDTCGQVLDYARVYDARKV